MNRLRLLCLTAVLALTAAPSSARAETGAIDAFAAKHAAVTALLDAGAEDAKLEAAVDELLDYDWISKAALGGPNRYASVCAQRCAEFEQLLRALIRTRYIEMLRKSGSAPIELVGQTAGKRGVYKVTTRVDAIKHGRTQRITVEYVMHQVDGRWQVRDIITDDVSLAKAYLYEFNKINRAEGIDGIIDKLSAAT